METKVIPLVIIGIFLLACCMQQEKEEQQSTQLRGVSLSPKSFQEEDFSTFFEKAAQTGDIVMWAGDWLELTREDGAPIVVMELASTHEYTPLVELSLTKNGELRRSLSENVETYTESAIAFAEKYNPPYLGLGVEVNILYENSPNDFNEFVIFYNDMYRSIKAVSPNTKVFTVFQLERMKGLQFWADAASSGRTQWGLLEKFTSDIVAFTTYPCLVYKNPSDIPEEYYTEISSHTEKPVAFTEIGWHTEASPSGWESSEAEQAAFIEKFFRLIEDSNPKLCIWSFLYDQDTIEPFRSMGLYRKNGKPKKGWNAWLEEER